MRISKFPITYELPEDVEILDVYIRKNEGYNKPGARKIKRALHKLANSALI